MTKRWHLVRHDAACRALAAAVAVDEVNRLGRPRRKATEFKRKRPRNPATKKK